MSDLKALREAKGWRREQLAALAGVSVMTIYRLERGENVPNVRTAQRLASALGVSLDVLIGKG